MSMAAAFTLPTDDPTPMTAWRYRRDARKLRARFERNPSALHLSLRALADRQDAVTAPIRRPVQYLDSLPITPVVVRLNATRPIVTRASSPCETAQENDPSGFANPSLLHGEAKGSETYAQVSDASASTESPYHNSAITSVLRASPDVVNSFTALVQTEISGGLLNYSARQRLLAHACELGMAKFEASLIIAALEYQSPAAYTFFPQKKRSMLPLVAVILTQSLIAAALIWAWRI